VIDIKAIIPAAGYGTRLWPLTKETPKPLIPVNAKPIIEHIINNILTIKEIDHIYIVTNQKFHAIFQEWLNSFRCDIPITLYNDETTSNENRLGQIGDINFVLEKAGINDNLLIIAGDNLFNFSLKTAFEEFKRRKTIINPLHDAKSIKVAQEQGTVVVDEDGKFIEFMEKSLTPKTTLISQGAYFFPKEKVNLIKKYLNEGNNADKMGYFMIWLIGKELVYGKIFKEKWFDVGWKESLETAKKEFKGFK